MTYNSGSFRPDPNPVRPCAGPCGRMTRPARMVKEAVDFPTVTRYDANHCGKCFRALGGERPKPVRVYKPRFSEEQLAYSEAGLNSYFARRREREEKRKRQERMLSA